MSEVKQSRLKGVALIFACGTALFSDGYANGVIGNVTTLLGRVYGAEALDKSNYSVTLRSVTFAGTIVGMILFGYLSDKIGRKFGMMSAALIVAFFSALSACSSGANGSVSGLLAMLTACRFLLGIGVGAEYPCGSVAASEQTEGAGVARNAQHRWFVLATNSMIDLGFVISSFTPLVLYWIFGQNHLRAVWRGSLFLGTFPAIAILIWRWTIDEPERYKKDSMKHAKIPYMLVIRRYWVSLAAISVVWFLYNFIVYPFGLYSATITNNVSGNAESIAFIFGWNTVINLFYIPGTITGALIVDRLGPKWTMILGLVSQAVIGFIMSSLYERLTNNIAAFAVVYGIFLSFGELGPGNCLGLLASKTSPTGVRGQFYGVAAAVGKLGAFVGTWVFPEIIDAFGGASTTRGNTGPFWIGSGMAIASALITFFFIKPLDHDGMDKEDAAFREYLVAHGYDVSQMGLKVGGGSQTRESDLEASGEKKTTLAE